MRKNLKIWHPELCNISDDAEIGDNVVIHSHCVIFNKTKIGDNTRIQSFCFIPSGITIGNNVFLAPAIKFANDSRPPSHGKHWKETVVEDGVVIGINSTILPGITIGKNAFVGANALVTKNIPPNEVWHGSPAKFIKMRKDL